MKARFVQLVLGFFLLFSCTASFAQTIEEQMTKTNPGCQTLFSNAMRVIPQQYETRSFDSLQKALTLWESYCGTWQELKIMRLLIDIQIDQFKLPADAAPLLQLLEQYTLHYPRTAPIAANSKGDAVQNFFYLSATWAANLLKEKKLSTNERFICRVLTHEIENPRREVQRNAEIYPEFGSSMKLQLEQERKMELHANYAISSGIWIPTGDLSVVGNHPFIGFHIGARDPHFQLDLSLLVRFANAPHPFFFKSMQDSTDTFTGIHLGGDFIYYPVVHKRIDLGFIAGLGYETFDPQDMDPEFIDDLLTFKTVNFSTGIRWNYYLSKSIYIGAEGRYHLIHYKNDYRTSVNGNALSCNLILGFNKRRRLH